MELEKVLFYINELKPGRAMDALIAEKIFGWTWVTGILALDQPCLAKPSLLALHPKALPTDKRSTSGTFPHYSTNMADAWKIVDAFRAKDKKLVLHENMSRKEHKNYYAYIGKEHMIGEEPWFISGETGAEAVCKAGLIALWELE